MKKIINVIKYIMIFFLISSFLLFLISIFKVYATENRYTTRLLGRGICLNNISSKLYINDKEILNKDFYNKLQGEIKKTYQSRTTYKLNSIDTIYGYKNKYIDVVKKDTLIGAYYHDNNIKIAIMAGMDNSEYTNNYSSYLQGIDLKKYNYHASIPELTIDTIKNNLSNKFIRELENILSCNYSVAFLEFFRYNPSHLLLSADFGGSINLINHFYSNDYFLSEHYGKELDNEINQVLANLENSQYPQNTIENVLIKYNNKIKYKLFLQVCGGDKTKITNFNDLVKNYSYWISSTNNSEELINIPLNGAIPIWDILPEHLKDHRERLKNYYEYYCTETQIMSISTQDRFNRLPTYATYEFYNVDSNRPSYLKEGIINDSGFLKNNVKDYINLNDYYVPLDYLLFRKFKKVLINIKIDIKEIYDGYQHIGIFDNKMNYITHIKSEHGYRKTMTNYKTFYLTMSLFDINKLNGSNYINIRYDASGFLRDDWVNKKVNITVKFLR